MRVVLFAAVALLLSGCSEDAGRVQSDEGSQVTVEDAVDQADTGMMDPAPTTTEVTQQVAYEATFKPNVCLVGSCAVGGIGALYVHEEAGGDLASGQLKVKATATAPNEVLRIVVGVYESCDDGAECTRVADLVAEEGSGDLDMDVPAYDLLAGQRVGVRFIPTAPVAVAFGTAGWTVELSGSLTFAQMA